MRKDLTLSSRQCQLLMSALDRNWNVQTVLKSPIIKIRSAALFVFKCGHLDGWVDKDRRTEMVEPKRRTFARVRCERAGKSKTIRLHHCIQSLSSAQTLAQPYRVSGWFSSRNSYGMTGWNRSGLRITPAVNQTEGNFVNLKPLLSVVRQTSISRTRHSNQQ
jgi:hypothetical protein